MMNAGNSFRKLFSVVLVVVLLVCSSIPALAVSKGDILRVRADYARVRSGARAGADVMAKLRKGTKVVYRGETNGWVLIELGNGKKGFMYKSMLTNYSAPKAGKVYRSALSKGKLPVYNADGQRIGSLNNSTEVVLLRRSGFRGLVRVVRNGKVGIVNVKYLKAS